MALQTKTNRIVVKLSGASFAGAKANMIIEDSFINDIAKQLVSISKKQQVGVVIGGGNIWRGNIGKALDMNPNDADAMGMLATIMNSIALANAIRNQKGNAKIFSSVEVKGICDAFNYEKVDSYLNETDGNIAIYAGGTGSPFFTTDTAAALRACQTSCKTIYMGKNGVDGVYDSDPRTNKNAKRYDKLTYKEVIEKDLRVMDLTAITMCQQNGVELIVFKTLMKRIH